MAAFIGRMGSFSARAMAARGPALAVACAAGSLAQLSSSPAECSWLFGKSSEVKRLEEETAKLLAELEATRKEKEAERVAKEEMIQKKAMKTQMHEMALGVGASVANIGSTGVPQNLSYGFVAGFCSGYAAKKAGKLVAVVAGGVYAGLQVLAFNGYIEINHGNIEASLVGVADLNKDGVVDMKDFSEACSRTTALDQITSRGRSYSPRWLAPHLAYPKVFAPL